MPVPGSGSGICFAKMLRVAAASPALSLMRRVLVAASRLSGVKLARPAAVDAARVPRNPRLYIVSLLSGEPESYRRHRVVDRHSANHSLSLCSLDGGVR